MMHSALVPAAKLEDDFYDWYERHASKCALAAGRRYPLIFIGDSITHLFEGDAGLGSRGLRWWREAFGAHDPLNLGFGWDRTQNVLWRLANGEFAGQQPPLVVLNIGTNNLTGSIHAPTNTPAQIDEGQRAICALIHKASPATHILLMGIFPRSTPDDPLRRQIREINALAALHVAETENISFLDIGHLFLEADGRIAPHLMEDRVHPTEEGYRIWAEAILPVVQARLG